MRMKPRNDRSAITDRIASLDKSNCSTGDAGSECRARLLSEPEAAKLLTISPRQLRQYRYDGKVPFIPIGERRVAYDIDSLRDWWRGLEVRHDA